MMKPLHWSEVLALLLGWLLAQALADAAPTGRATWFSVASTTREGTGGPRHLMASGQPLDDTALLCALPHHRFGGWYRVCRADQPRRCVRVQHQDYGPGRGPQRRGVIVDLSRAAFARLASLDDGVLAVTVEPLR